MADYNSALTGKQIDERLAKVPELAQSVSDLSADNETIKQDIETVKTSVSEGKALIASAVTDKGVPTADDATFAVMAANIRAISGDQDEEEIPSYHYVEAARVAENIRAWKKTHENSLIFGTVSDNHVYIRNATHEVLSKASIRHGAFALETVGAMVGADFVANLGDNCWENGIDASMDQDGDATNAYEGALYATGVLKSAFERLTAFAVPGNHDKSDDTQKLFNLIGSVNSFDDYGITQIRGYGYKDFTSKKVRVICLNNVDYLNASGGYGMSYEQKDWLMRSLDLSAKSNASDWQILILSHFPMDFDGGDYNIFADLKAILAAYVGGSNAKITVNTKYALNENPATYPTYSNGYLTYNYAGKNAARIIANIHGHVHTDVFKKMTAGVLRMATPNTCFYLGKTTSYPDNGDYSITTAISRTAGTATDTAAVFYCVDLDEQEITAFAYGAGTDRVASYKKATTYTVTYNLTNVTTSDDKSNPIENGGVYTAQLMVKDGAVMQKVIITMGNVDITETAYDAKTGIILIEIVTGDIKIFASAIVQPSYTNIIDTVGTEDDVRLRSGGATGSAAGFASGYFEAHGGDVIRVYFPNGNRSSIPSNGVYCCTYSNTNGTLVTAYDGSTSSTVLKNVTDTGYEIHIPSSVNCNYARVAGGPNGAYAGWVVTVNEEIT